MKGFIPNIYAILGFHDMLENLTNYVCAGFFQNKTQWSRVYKLAIKKYEIERWKANMSVKTTCPLANLTLRGPQPFRLYKLAKTHTREKMNLLLCCQLLSIPTQKNHVFANTVAITFTIAQRI